MASNEELRKHTATLLRSAGLTCRRIHPEDPAAALLAFKALADEVIEAWDHEVRITDL